MIYIGSPATQQRSKGLRDQYHDPTRRSNDRLLHHIHVSSSVLYFIGIVLDHSHNLRREELMEYYIDDIYDFLMDALDQERALEKYHEKANWLAEEEPDCEQFDGATTT